jgi:hypothetical protein
VLWHFLSSTLIYYGKVTSSPQWLSPNVDKEGEIFTDNIPDREKGESVTIRNPWVLIKPKDLEKGNQGISISEHSHERNKERDLFWVWPTTILRIKMHIRMYPLTIATIISGSKYPKKLVSSNNIYLKQSGLYFFTGFLLPGSISVLFLQLLATEIIQVNRWKSPQNLRSSFHIEHWSQVFLFIFVFL